MESVLKEEKVKKRICKAGRFLTRSERVRKSWMRRVYGESTEEEETGAGKGKSETEKSVRG